MKLAVVLVFAVTIAGSVAAKSADDCATEVGERSSAEERQNAIVTCLLADTEGEPLPMAAPAPNNAAALALAKKWAGKFAVEMAPSEPQLGSLRTVRVNLPRFRTMTEYDAAKGRVRFTSALSTFQAFTFHDECRPVGTYTGQNAYGAKARVRVQSCHEGVLHQVASGEPVSFFRGFTVKPNEYRAFVAAGLDVEVVYAVAANRTGQLAERGEATNKATIHEPIESNVTRWELWGEVQEVRGLLPGSKKVVLYRK